MYRGLIAVTFLFALGTAEGAIDGPVHLDAGMVTGVPASSPDVRVFKGIPFAAPPVGNLRWRAPKPPAHWTEVRKADQFGPICMQAAPNGSDQKVSEDCLYLNVWTGARSASEKRPVMVWIYGGGYNTGSGSQPLYDGEALAKKGVVVVTFNYRLGVFGFFSYPELSMESGREATGNFGLLDSIAALRWVKKNIAAFGGDPARVTIFGESAGAGMVANLMTVVQAKGLFERAIGDSSAWSTATLAKLKTLEDAEEEGVRYANSLGAKSLADLRAKPADVILKGGRGAGMIVDGAYVREEPSKIFAEGQQAEVPVLVGSNRDESFGGNPKSAAQFTDQVHKRFGDLAENFLKIYPAANDEEARESAFFSGRDEMAFLMRNWARLVARSDKGKAWVYYFTQQPPRVPNARGPFAPGPHGSATHVSEVAYVFDHLDKGREWTEADRKVADTMSSYWVNFAAAGDPNGKGLAKWTAWGDKTETPMVFGNAPEGRQIPSESGLKFYLSYFQKLFAE